MDNKKIYLLMIMSTIFWAGAFIAGKLSAPYIPAFTLTFLRFSLASLILYFVVKKKEPTQFKLSKKDIPVFTFTGIVGMFGYHVFFFNALKYTTAINSSIIAATNPLVTAILCIVFLKDKINSKRVFGIILSFVGVFLTITNANMSILINLSFNKGDILMLIAVLMWASYSVYSKKVMQYYSPLILTYYSFLFCSIFLIPFVIYEAPWRLIGTIPYYSYIASIYMSIFPSVIGYLVQQMSIKQIGPSKTAIFVNLVPIFSIILSTLILRETISPVKFLTALLIVTGVYICQKN
ncbi:Permease of the drug/metabolite transporter (DMT) superfamily [Caloramator quimbayensis]|uniref:Permease of the drug/metabolite transporter (DMT) superfamily n=1 Tax=Caloramator quimbayensis TaxID=1147123 RepID=A0A1T4Y5E6_9CLOT|nr:DMT family transporter [Caloramator quimbayensis]SKA97042.1 Permease of the drug/metabolite transporter (DMT) superfamily [Caloramator quimbayensis]